MHVGERPYVLSPSGPTNLSERPLTIEAMGGVLTDLLPEDDQRTLSEFGAVEREVLLTEAPGDRFVLVAARNGDDIWIELRRQRGAATGRKIQAAGSVADLLKPSHRPRMAPSHPPAAAPHTRTSVLTPPDAAAPPESLLGGSRQTPAREVQPAVVLPLARSPIRTETPRSTGTPSPKYLGVGRLLRTAAARGASSLYLIAESRPSIRIDDEILPLESEPPLGTAEVEALILELAPGPSREALAGGTSAEWVCELPDVGRVRCLSFRDQRGPGAVFRLIPTRLISADQLGLSRDIQALCGGARGPDARRGPAAQRQVDADLRVRRSHQPHAVRLPDQPRDRNQVRPREPQGDGQPARGARRAGGHAGRGARGAAREPGRAGHR